MSDEVRLRLLRYLADHPDATQRELARALGMSLGKVNYCVRALMARGCIKAQNFSRSANKTAYAYVLTAHGLEEKVALTYLFLRRKMNEYDHLREEIEGLTAEVDALERQPRNV